MICTVKSKTQTELIDITSNIQEIIVSADIAEGVCMLYVPHTTAAITINESADPSGYRCNHVLDGVRLSD